MAGEDVFEARRVRALGQPDPGRLESQEAARRAAAGAQLRFDRGPVEQRQIAMRRRGGEDLDVPAPRKIRERANQIASEADSVSLTEAAERGEIEVGERGAPRVALLHEAGRVPLRAANLVVDVLEVANVDVVIGKLLEEDRRESDDDAVAHALRTEIVKQHEERQVRSEHPFVGPLLAVP